MRDKCKVPRHFTGSDHWGFHIIGLQRTCKLVDEWSAKYGAKVEVRQDEDPVGLVKPVFGTYAVQYRLVERRYRVADWSQEAAEEAEWVAAFAVYSAKGKAKAAEKFRKLLAERGYSEAALAEEFSL